MVFDEVVYALVERLEAAGRGALHIELDHGMYVASFAIDRLEIEGETKPVLTDALASLLGLVP